MPKVKKKRFRSVLFGGFGKRDVVRYIEELYGSHMEKVNLSQQEIKELQQTVETLRNENGLLKENPAAVPPAAAVSGNEIKSEPYHAADANSALIISELEDELNKLNTQLTVQTEAADEARQVSEALRERVAQLSGELRKYDKARDTDYESLLYHRAEEIEREATYNAAQARLEVNNMIEEIKAVLLGMKAQTETETVQVAARTRAFLENLTAMPELFETVSAQFEGVRPPYVVTPIKDMDEE
jgi:chromosome segregation ATPase